MTDRHEVECDRVEEEFNGVEVIDPVVPQFHDEMTFGDGMREIRRLLVEISERLREMEARLDEHGII